LRSRLLIVVLAAVLALAGTIAVFAYARHANERAIAGLKTEAVIAVDRSVASGTTVAEALQAGQLTTLELPRSSVQQQGETISSTKDLGARVFNQDVPAGSLVLRPMLVSAGQATAASVLPLKNGMVAITLQMCIPEAVGGYLTAGALVDVYGTFPKGQQNLQRGCTPQHQALPPGAASTKLYLTNVKVLSVAQASTGTVSSSASSSVVTDPVSNAASALTTGTDAVTFEVNPGPDALTLLRIEQLGLPYLALLPPTTNP
jgi:pilus assembly protein CpaB